MIETIESRWLSANNQKSRNQFIWLFWYILLLGLTGLTGLFMIVVAPVPIVLAGILALGVLLAFVYEPRYAVYACLFFALAGDAILLPSYPFVKNLSSPESLLYINGALIFSPLEFLLVLILVAWLGKGVMRRKMEFYRGELFWPVAAFTACLVGGLIYGIGTGGDPNVALWEVRPIFYAPLLFVFTSNLLTERTHLMQVMWLAMGALFVEGIVGTLYYLVKLGGNLAGVEAITEHSAAIHMNTLFVFVIALWLCQGSMAKRVTLMLMIPPVAITYLATQRRASYLTLVIALALLMMVLFRLHRKIFLVLAPTALLFGVLYLGVFWNNNSALGMPAQAIRSVLAPEEDSEDALSNAYRVVENINVGYTIHQSPLTGVGFGQKFSIIVPMPDISFFVWWEYIVHNSIMWIWIKTGFFGFVAMLFMVGYSVMWGARAIWRMPGGDLQAVAMTATIYLVMHFVYAYVDMSWDNQSMVYLGVMLGILNSIERIVAKPVPLPEKRWPWQPDPVPAPGLVEHGIRLAHSG